MSAPAFLSRAEVARELRSAINHHSNHMGGKYVPSKTLGDVWKEIATGDARAKRIR